MSATRWLVLALLVASITINYIHRSALSVAAALPAFRHDIPLRDTQLGLLFAAFFWPYALLQPLAGYLIDRRGVFGIFTAGFLVWSAAILGTGLARGFASLFLLRLLLGVGESVAYPAYAKVIASGFPEERRGMANALIDAGSRSGPAICVLAGGAIAISFGYRAMFFLLGAGGLLWLVPWLLCARYVPAAGAEAPRAGGPGFAQILRQRQAWGTFLALFCLNFTWVFVLSWLPSYLVRERHYTTAMMSIYGQLPFWGYAGTCAVFGWISDRLIVRGLRPTPVRIGFVATGMFLSMLLLPACLVSSQAMSLALLIVACLSLGLASSNIGAITQTLAGPGVVGRWMGLQNGIGNLAGMAGPSLTGLLVARSGTFHSAFVLTCLCSAMGGCSYLFLVRRAEPIDWGMAGG